MNVGLKLLIIGFVWPEPNSSAAGERMMQLIEAFQSNGFDITFASSAAESKHAVDLSHLGITVEKIKLNDGSFDLYIKDLQPDVVLFDRFMTEEQFGWRVTEQCPNAMRILDTEDLHSLRKTRQEAYKQKTKFTIETWLSNPIAKREIASIYRSDLSLIISEHEEQLLLNNLKIDRSLLFYLPYMIDKPSDDDLKELPNYNDREHFITIGNFRHEPNYNSVLFLKETIWPLVKREMPETELHIYGAYPTKKILQLNAPKDAFFIKGWADDAKQVLMQSRVCLAPLQFGAGLKGKFVKAMQVGTPSVTTSIGAEGLVDGFGGLVEDDPIKIAAKSVELYRDESLWKSKQADGFNLINRKFNKLVLQADLMKKVMDTKNQLGKLRRDNFIGAMLQHHTIQSTKYMGKWIEEKNK